MSENVSSKVLFHFTSSLDNLKSILQDGFFPHLCPEYTITEQDHRAAANHMPPACCVPMVSFCDLPLALIGPHLKKYGSFGIGLKKKWGIQHGISPVIYAHSKARTHPALFRFISYPPESNNMQAIKDGEVLAGFTKPFEGPSWRKGVIKRARFYDEREWRYLPGPDPFFGFNIYNNFRLRNKLHKNFKKNFSLKITPDDIQYLIVKYDSGEKNILKLYDFIMRLYSRRFSPTDAKLVSTAIMTDDCIKDDI